MIPPHPRHGELHIELEGDLISRMVLYDGPAEDV